MNWTPVRSPDGSITYPRNEARARRRREVRALLMSGLLPVARPSGAMHAHACENARRLRQRERCA